MVTVICGFILPRYILLYFGSDVNGLVTSITDFLGFITLLEMGIGPVVQANLFRPLAEKNEEQVSRILISAERFFRRIAFLFLAYILILAVVFPLFLEKEQSAWFTVSLILIISVSTFAEYFFGITYQQLLSADQKNYIPSLLSTVATLLNTVLCIFLIRLGGNIHMVKMVTAALFVLRPLGQALYVRKHYRLNKKLILTEEPIKQKWNGFAQHMASVVNGKADVAILTVFSTSAVVSVYSVYFLVVNGVTSLVFNLSTGLEAFFGNMIAKNEKETLNSSFGVIEWIYHSVVAVIFAVTAALIVPFVSVYTRGIEDANYIFPLFGLFLVIAYGFRCLKAPYHSIVNAAGRFKETQMGAFIATGLNVAVSLALIFPLGLQGIAIGTLAGMLFQTVYFVFYLHRHILYRSPWIFLRYLFTDALVVGGVYAVAGRFSLSALTYPAWILLALKVGGIAVGIAILANLLINGNLIVRMFRQWRGKKKA